MIRNRNCGKRKVVKIFVILVRGTIYACRYWEGIVNPTRCPQSYLFIRIRFLISGNLQTALRSNESNWKLSIRKLKSPPSFILSRHMICEQRSFVRFVSSHVLLKIGDMTSCNIKSSKADDVRLLEPTAALIESTISIVSRRERKVGELFEADKRPQ